jgi:hypothetical protein
MWRNTWQAYSNFYLLFINSWVKIYSPWTFTKICTFHVTKCTFILKNIKHFSIISGTESINASKLAPFLFKKLKAWFYVMKHCSTKINFAAEYCKNCTLFVLLNSIRGLDRPWGFQISRQSTHEDGKVVSFSFVRDWVNPRVLVRHEGLCERKSPKIPSGIEPANFRFVAQCLK